MPDRLRRRLKDSPEFLPDPYQRPVPWIKTDLTPAEDAIGLVLSCPDDYETKVTPARGKANSIGKFKAYQFVAMLRDGIKPGEAAHRLHTSVKALMDQPETSKLIEATIAEYTWDADRRRLIVRAAANKTIAENLGPTGDKKLLMEALKFVAEDSEVAIKGAGTTNVQVDVSLQKMLSQPVEPFPGIPAPAEVTDVTFEDEK